MVRLEEKYDVLDGVPCRNSSLQLPHGFYRPLESPHVSAQSCMGPTSSSLTTSPSRSTVSAAELRVSPKALAADPADVRRRHAGRVADYEGLGICGLSVVIDLRPVRLNDLQSIRHSCCLLPDVRKAPWTRFARQFPFAGDRISARYSRSRGSKMKFANTFILLES